LVANSQPFPEFPEELSIAIAPEDTAGSRDRAEIPGRRTPRTRALTSGVSCFGSILRVPK
jgi:hypothetical protein